MTIEQKAREIAMGIAPGTVKRAHIAATEIAQAIRQGEQA